MGLLLLLATAAASLSSPSRRWALSRAVGRQLPTFLSLPSAEYREGRDWAVSSQRRRLPARLSAHASEHIMGGMPLGVEEGRGGEADGVDEEGGVELAAERGQREAEEEARLIAMYQHDFAAEWTAEQRGKRSPPAVQQSAAVPHSAFPSSRNRSRVDEILRPSSVLSSSLVLPAASHAAKRGKVSLKGGSSPPSSPPIVWPPFAVAVLLSVSSELCRAAWLQYRSLQRVHPGEFDYVVAYQTEDAAAEWRSITSDPHCSLLFAHSHTLHQLTRSSEQGADTQLPSPPPPSSSAPVGRVRFLPLHPIPLPVWSAPRFARWSYCYNKLALLGLAEYDKVLYLDVDVVVAAPLSSFFQLPYQMAAGLDTAQNCHKAHTKLNAGVWLFAPSAHLHAAFLSALHDRASSCISGVLEEAEQELLNCLCGMGQLGEPALSLRPELVCGVLPYYANVVPSYSQCDDYDADDVLLLHFADMPKPWQWEDAECQAVAVNATWEREDAWFEADERRRCFSPQLHALTFYHCMEGGAQHSSRQLSIDRDCRLINVDDASIRTAISRRGRGRLKEPG